jgi:hypothetical protein
MSRHFQWVFPVRIVSHSVQQNEVMFPFSLLSYSMAVQSLKDLDRLTRGTFINLCRHSVELLGRVISPSQGLYLHRTAWYRKTRTNIHALSGIRTHDPSAWAIKARTLDPYSLPYFIPKKCLSSVAWLVGYDPLPIWLVGYDPLPIWSLALVSRGI